MKKEIKELHLLCNAHLDPVWLWQRQEGMAEAISTFRVAAKFCEEYNGFVFNHNEAVLYEWVEEHEPALFRRIQTLVKAGKWHIMGGWYIQPDCNMPSGESIIRQIEVGNRYFRERFGVKPTTAINFDSFGHTRGLVQILKKWGYDSYVFMRSGSDFRDLDYDNHDFLWRGYDGSEIVGHCIFASYHTLKGGAVQRIEKALSEEEAAAQLILWGIGNHGGGPSREDLESIFRYQQAHPEVKLTHSWCEKYIATVDRTGLPVFEKSLIHCMVGCYTSMVRIKQKHRQLENELGLCEKMLALSGVEYDDQELDRAQKALLFNEFHDILPGTIIKKAEEDSLRYMEYGREILSRYCAKAFFKLCEGQKEGKAEKIPIFVFNPNPYPTEEIIEVEFQLEDQNWEENQLTMPRVRDEDGNYLPTQLEKEECCMNLDWRKHVVFRAKLEPMSLNRFDCVLTVEELPKRPVESCQESDRYFIIRTDSMEVFINKETGLLDRYRVDGRDYLREGSASIQVYADNEDPWAMRTDGFYDHIDAFRAVSDEEANRFNGYPDRAYGNVRVIENGAVRCKIQAIMKYSDSWAVVTYTIPKQGRYIDLKIKILSNDVNRMYKLAFYTDTEHAEFVGQTAFGRETLRRDEKEVTFQKWCGMLSQDGGFAVLNRGTYGGSAGEKCMNISLMRTPVYSAHPIKERELTDSDRHHDHIDLGEREFEYRLTADVEYLDADSEAYNQNVYALSFFPDGADFAEEEECTKGIFHRGGLSVSNRHLVLTSLKKVEGEGISVRLFNASGQANSGELRNGSDSLHVALDPYEIKTLLIQGNR